MSFGFTEPYLRDKPISVGAQVFAPSTTSTLEEPVDDRRDRESVGGAAVAADELQHVDDRPDA